MPGESRANAAQTPDFDIYPIAEAIRTATTDGRILTLEWSDGRSSRYHAIWLRMNTCDPETFNLDTREITRSPLDLPVEVRIERVSVRSDGAVGLVFQPEGHAALFDPGWLRAHDYSNGGRSVRSHRRSTAQVSWMMTRRSRRS